MGNVKIRKMGRITIRRQKDMRKKMIYAMIAAGVMTAGLTGCGEKKAETETVQTEATQTETAQENAVIQNESAATENTGDAAKGESTSGSADVTLMDGNLQVAVDSLGDQVAFIDYDSNGTAMQVMLYKGEDGMVRGALNTCQVCAGSPYAYFEQEGSDVVCQNCGNHFSVDAIGDAHGGCNPVPLELSDDGKNVVIDTAVLDEQAGAFTNWKKGI